MGNGACDMMLGSICDERFCVIDEKRTKCLEVQFRHDAGFT
eukprot:gene26643-48021_t